MFKDEFPNHFVWEESKWITRVGGEYFQNKCKSEQGRGDMDMSEDTNIGLYSKALPCINVIDDHWISKIDLEQVNLNLMKTV